MPSRGGELRLGQEAFQHPSYRPHGRMGRGVGHPHRADQGHLAAAPITGAVVGLHHGAVPQGGVGMLGPNPDAPLLQHLLGGVFHQLHQGAQGGRLAEFRLAQQAG